MRSVSHWAQAGCVVILKMAYGMVRVMKPGWSISLKFFSRGLKPIAAKYANAIQS